jgi:hypothetical protein
LVKFKPTRAAFGESLAFGRARLNFPAGMGELREKDSWDDVIAVYKRDLDYSLLRENLKLTHAERLEKFVSFLRFAEECGKQATKPCSFRLTGGGWAFKRFGSISRIGSASRFCFNKIK